MGISAGAEEVLKAIQAMQWIFYILIWNAANLVQVFCARAVSILLYWRVVESGQYSLGVIFNAYSWSESFGVTGKLSATCHSERQGCRSKTNVKLLFLMIRRKNCRVLGVGIFNRRAPQVKGENPKHLERCFWSVPPTTWSRDDNLK